MSRKVVADTKRCVLPEVLPVGSNQLLEAQRTETIVFMCDRQQLCNFSSQR